jgi:hypothetical protein
MIPRVKLVPVKLVPKVAPTETLQFHPLADIFPLMEGEEFDALVADIKTNGCREPIVLYEEKILDGRNRYRACLAADKPFNTVRGLLTGRPIQGPHGSYQGIRDDKDAFALVISANIHRRHLTAEQKHNFLVELVKASPKKSDRALAKEACTTHPTVAKARKQAEATGKALPVELRVGLDGKARKQPAKKKRPPVDKRDVAAKKAGVVVAPPTKTVPEVIAPDEELALLREFARWFVSERVRVSYDPKDRDEWRGLFSQVKAVLVGSK